MRAAIATRQAPLLVVSAVAMLGAEAYTGSETHRRYLAPSRLGDQLVAIGQIGPTQSKRWNMISVIRGDDAPPFSHRDRRLMRILAAELKPLVGTRLADSTSPVMRLTPRQHHTLRLLLAGGSEAAIAAEIRVSRSTLHKYVVGLYRLFNINSRGELQAYFGATGLLSTEREQVSDPRHSRTRRKGVPMTVPWRTAATSRSVSTPTAGPDKPQPADPS